VNGSPVGDGTAASAGPRIVDLDRELAQAFPREWAEDWDRVGLLAGDPDREITRVLVTLDPTRSAIARAASMGANVLLTHHPAALSMPERLTRGRGSAGTLFAALDAGVALIAEHTNLDRAPEGVATLPKLLGLDAIKPIERSLQPMTRVCVYAPPESADAIVDAMSAVGAGRIGAYERCAFSDAGVGRFTPLPGSSPCAGAVGIPSRADELRIEMVCAPPATTAVIAAARSCHPYEEPLIVTEPVAIARSSARMGMQCELKAPATLAEMAATAAAAFGVTPRVWGSRSRAVRTCVTATGSAGSLLPDVFASGADALVCGEVRYHDALDAAEAGLSIIEVGHDVSEWPLVAVLGLAARTTLGLSAEMVEIETPTAGWWTP
jgi:dinuclear metal center YbgI/SA1388 family protein